MALWPGIHRTVRWYPCCSGDVADLIRWLIVLIFVLLELGLCSDRNAAFESLQISGSLPQGRESLMLAPVNAERCKKNLCQLGNIATFSFRWLSFGVSEKLFYNSIFILDSRLFSCPVHAKYSHFRVVHTVYFLREWTLLSGRKK